MPTTDADLMQWSMFAMSTTTWIDVLLNFLVAIAYGFFVSVIYRHCRGLHANRSFIQTLYMLTLIITLIMMIILSIRGTAAVAVAFGLMGALSIIRFRTVVKDNRDTAFVFLAVGVGMASGTGKWWIGFAGLAVIGVTLMMLENAPWGRNKRSIIVKLTFRPHGADEKDVTRDIGNILAQLGSQVHMIHVRTIRLGELIETTYALNLYKNITPNYAIEQILAISGVDSVNIFNPQDLQEP